ncbi:hypothetical protein SBA4_4070003 [Candidatus Sulfopaludibacter sp. SbA4]|nr:hypothetical protein SBA4_4070003 [Candidatus Sulfopaludibacter sp. SbA4]
METFKATGFLPFLEGLQKHRASPAGRGRVSGGNTLSVLTVLNATRQRSMAIFELHEATGMGFLDFSQAILSLEDMGFVAISGEPGDEAARLTKLGVDIADLVHSA